MSRADPIFRLRLPDPLKERLKELAGTGRRSLTQEIVDRLQKSVDAEDAAGLPDTSDPTFGQAVRKAAAASPDARLADLEQRLKALEDWRGSRIFLTRKKP